MTYDVKLSKNVQKFLSKHPEIIDDFDKAAGELAKNPRPMPGCKLDIVPYKEGGKDNYRLRISKYRFLYEVVDHRVEVDVYDAGSR